MEALHEMLWNQSHAAGRAIEKHPNAWVHFTNVPKLGINPRTGMAGHNDRPHHDPPGVYFYPTKWLNDLNWSGFQYGLSMKYYYICRLDMRTGKGLNLSRMTWQQANRIAINNNWADWLQKGISILHQNEGVPPKKRTWGFLDKSTADKKQLKKAGGMFYAVADYLASEEGGGRRWLTMLKGVDYIWDPGLGVISPNEISQMIVMNTKLIHILEFGENKDESNNRYVEMLQRLAQKYNGKVEFKNKIPILTITVDGKPMRVIYDPFYKLMTSFIYYRNGMLISDQDRIEGVFSDHPVDSMERSLDYEIKSRAEKADATGHDTVWGRERIIWLADQLFVKGQHQRFRGAYLEKEHQQYYSVEGANTSFDYGGSHVNFVINDHDVLTVKVEVFATKKEIDVDVVRQFQPNTDIRTIPLTLITDIGERLKEEARRLGLHSFGLGILSRLNFPKGMMGDPQDYKRWVDANNERFAQEAIAKQAAKRT